MVSGYNFTQALATFAAHLKNNPALAATIQGYEAVKMQFHKGVLTITEAETFQKEASSLKGKLNDAENELKQAKKTIGAQEKTIEDLTARLEEATANQQETEKIANPQKKRRTKQDEDC